MASVQGARQTGKRLPVLLAATVAGRILGAGFCRQKRHGAGDARRAVALDRRGRKPGHRRRRGRGSFSSTRPRLATPTLATEPPGGAARHAFTAARRRAAWAAETQGCGATSTPLNRNSRKPLRTARAAPALSPDARASSATGSAVGGQRRGWLQHRVAVVDLMRRQRGQRAPRPPRRRRASQASRNGDHAASYAGSTSAAARARKVQQPARPACAVCAPRRRGCPKAAPGRHRARTPVGVGGVLPGARDSRQAKSMRDAGLAAPAPCTASGPVERHARPRQGVGRLFQAGGGGANQHGIQGGNSSGATPASR